MLSPYMASSDTPVARSWRRRIFIAVSLFGFFYGLVFAFFAPFMMVAFVVPIALLGALVIWALPDGLRIPTRSMDRLFFVYIAAVALWPDYLAIALPGMPWITVTRLTGVPLALMLLISASSSSGFRGDLARALNAEPIIWKAMAAFVFLQFISIGFSAQPAFSVDKFLTAQTDWTAVFVVACWIFTRPGRATKGAAMLWIVAIVIGIIGILESRHGRVLWSGHVPGFLKVNDPNIQMTLASGSRAGSGIYRVQSTFSTALGLAEYLSLTVPFVLHFALADYRPLIRMAAAASLPFLAFVIFLSGSRSGSIGFLMAFLMYGVWWGVRRWKRAPDGLLGQSVIFAYPFMAFFVLLATFFVGRLHRLVWGGGETANSTLARQVQWGMGIPKILSHPWGYGIGRGGITLQYFVPGGLLTIDSYFLVLLLEYGVLGFALYLFIIGFTAFKSVRTMFYSKSNFGERELLIPISVSLVVFVVIKGVFAQQDNHPIVFMILGMAVALLGRKDREEAVPAATEISPYRPRYAA